MAERPIRTPDQRLRVFISSTLGELADERLAARASVEHLRLTPVMFELGARPHPPRALYRSYLAQSDVFVGVYWERYGWVAPDMQISGLEDELVLSQHMPRLVYVKTPAPAIEPRLADMLARLESDGSASYKPFRDADELHELLLDDLAILLTERFGAVREAASPTPARVNLPNPTSTFLGREAELRELSELLGTEDVRLITLTGPGGTGKTRLALRLAADEGEGFADGVCFVDLSAEREVDDAFAAIDRALGVVVASDGPPLDALVRELQDGRMLLVLDNFEQVMPAAVGVVDLLQRCPNLKVLATSREALRVRGERVFPVPPMSLPDPGDPKSALDSEAVRLFSDRAVAVQPGFSVREDNAEAVSAICRHLDGLPLAIELAAARVQLFDVEDLRVRLEDRLEVLRGGARDLPKRQQTLRDAISWSYDLLTPDERQVLRFLGVFADARLMDIDATARRIPDMRSVDLIDALGSLVDKSLLRSAPGPDGRPRFSMLLVIRAYALEQLDATPDLAAAARRAHAEHYTDLALQLHQELARSERRDVLTALSGELGNLRSAWDEWVERGEVPRLNDLLAPLWGYYDARGDYRSAIELGHDLLRCLAETPDSPERRRDQFAVRMSVVRTELAISGYTAEAEQMIRDALEPAGAAGDARQRFPGLRALGYLHVMRSDFEQTWVIASELMAIANEEQDPLLLSDAHMLSGLSSAWRVGLTASLEHYDKAVGYAEATRSGYIDFRVGPHPGVVANVVRGLTQWMVGTPHAALATMQRALEVAADIDHPFSMAYALHHAALLDLWRLDLAGAMERTDGLWSIAEAHDYPTWRALALILGGTAMVGSGEVDVGLVRVDDGFALYEGLSTPPVFWPPLLMIRANALGWAGRADDGLAVIDAAAVALQPGDPLAPDVDLVHGDLLLALSPPDVAGAEAKFAAAAMLAGGAGARMAQLQALTRLVVLRSGSPDEAEARRTLRAVYDEFTEGFDSPHLVAAAAVLDTDRPA